MATRAIWEGTVGFGLVQIPVQLYPAESRKAQIDLDLLDRRDMAPVGYQRINRETGEPVDWGDIVKGYAYKKGEYVLLEEDDFRRASVKATQSVDIVQFADQGEIDITYYEKPYYLVPTRRGERPYALLREALRATGKVGIARVVIRTRESLAAVVVRGDALILELLRFHHELVPAAEFDFPASGEDGPKLSAAERKMAERLIEDMSAEFKPEEFRDTYHDKLIGFIQQKIEGEVGPEEVAEEAAPEPGKVVDIMSLLKQSLERKKPRNPAPKAEATAKASRPARGKASAKTGTKKAASRARPAARKAS